MTDIISSGNYSDDKLLAIAAAAEKGSEHSLGEVIIVITSYSIHYTKLYDTVILTDNHREKYAKKRFYPDYRLIG